MPLHGGARFALLILTAGVWHTGAADDARGFARGNRERRRGADADASDRSDWQNSNVKVVGEHNTGASTSYPILLSTAEVRVGVGVVSFAVALAAGE
jgi:hypothetical protein